MTRDSASAWIATEEASLSLPFARWRAMSVDAPTPMPPPSPAMIQ